MKAHLGIQGGSSISFHSAKPFISDLNASMLSRSDVSFSSKSLYNVQTVQLHLQISQLYIYIIYTCICNAFMTVYKETKAICQHSLLSKLTRTKMARPKNLGRLKGLGGVQSFDSSVGLDRTAATEQHVSPSVSVPLQGPVIFPTAPFQLFQHLREKRTVACSCDQARTNHVNVL